MGSRRFRQVVPSLVPEEESRRLDAGSSGCARARAGLLDASPSPFVIDLIGSGCGRLCRRNGATRPRAGRGCIAYPQNGCLLVAPACRIPSVCLVLRHLLRSPRLYQLTAISSARQVYCRDAGYADRADDAPACASHCPPHLSRAGRGREESLSRYPTSIQQMPDLDRALRNRCRSTGRCHLPRGRTDLPAADTDSGHGPPEQDVKREWLTCHYRCCGRHSH